MYKERMVLKMYFVLKGHFANIAFNLTLLQKFREMRLLEILYKSSQSVELVYALADYELFIPKVDKAYFWSFLLI